jgi:hypothetical protein
MPFGQCVNEQGSDCLGTPAPDGSKSFVMNNFANAQKHVPASTEQGPILCNDGVDNDCSGKFDQYADSCRGEVNDDNGIMCAGLTEACKITDYNKKYFNDMPLGDYGLFCDTVDSSNTLNFCKCEPKKFSLNVQSPLDVDANFWEIKSLDSQGSFEGQFCLPGKDNIISVQDSSVKTWIVSFAPYNLFIFIDNFGSETYVIDNLKVSSSSKKLVSGADVDCSFVCSNGKIVENSDSCGGELTLFGSNFFMSSLH